MGSALGTDEDLAFRNLDGTCQVLGEVRPGAPLRTITTLKSISRSGGMVLESFQVRRLLGDTPVLEMETGFGFFPAATFANQAGLGSTAVPRHGNHQRGQRRNAGDCVPAHSTAEST